MSHHCQTLCLTSGLAAILPSPSGSLFLGHPPSWGRGSSQFQLSVAFPLSWPHYNHLYRVCYSCCIVGSLEHPAQGLAHNGQFEKSYLMSKQMDEWGPLWSLQGNYATHIFERKESKLNFIKMVWYGVLNAKMKSKYLVLTFALWCSLHRITTRLTARPLELAAVIWILVLVSCILGRGTHLS